MSKVYFGVDISEHNGTVDWSKVAKKVDFAILRIGWVGNNSNAIDKKFADNYTAAKKAGVKLGAYVYMYSKTASAAKSGAEWVLKQIKDKTFDLPVYCDMEDSTIAGLGKATLTEIADTFNKAIIKGGFKAGIYANLDWFRNKLNSSIKSYPTWIAHYTSGTNKYQGEYDMWQNSSKGKVDGVNGNVDTNYLYKDMFTTKATTTKTTTTTSTTKKSNAPTYKVGNTYALQVDLKVRKGAGTNYAQKLRSSLTTDGKKNAKSGLYAVLEKGTKVTIKAIKTVGNNIWLEIPSGWIAGYYNGNIYVK
jgi:GH25 family lysozyme M1 (1,4-beta-N-acetylmuramidase)